jgi:hypothetical protein
MAASTFIKIIVEMLKISKKLLLSKKKKNCERKFLNIKK